MIINKIGCFQQTVGTLLANLWSAKSFVPNLSFQVLSGINDAIFPSTSVKFKKIPLDKILSVNSTELYLYVYAYIIDKIGRLSDKLTIVVDQRNIHTELDYLWKAYIASAIDNYNFMTGDVPSDDKEIFGTDVNSIIKKFISFHNLFLGSIGNAKMQVKEYLERLASSLVDTPTFVDPLLAHEIMHGNIHVQANLAPSYNSDLGSQIWKKLVDTKYTVSTPFQKVLTQKWYEWRGVKVSKGLSVPQHPLVVKAYSKIGSKRTLGQYRKVVINESYESLLKDDMFDHTYRDAQSTTNAIQLYEALGAKFKGSIYLITQKAITGLKSLVSDGVYELAQAAIKSTTPAGVNSIEFESVLLKYPTAIREVPNKEQILFNAEFSGDCIYTDALNVDTFASGLFTKLTVVGRNIGKINLNYAVWSDKTKSYDKKVVEIEFHKYLAGETYPFDLFVSKLPFFRELPKEKISSIVTTVILNDRYVNEIWKSISARDLKLQFNTEAEETKTKRAIAIGFFDELFYVIHHRREFLDRYLEMTN